MSECKKSEGRCEGPGWRTPLDAMRFGPRETLLYVVCIQPDGGASGKSDYLSTVDVDPSSPDYCKVISRLPTGRIGDELHHSGWNICSSCCDRAPEGLTRDKLIMPGLNSDRLFIVDVGTDPRNPKMHHVVEAEEMHQFDCATPHTVHCTATHVMISIMGDKNGNGKCDYILLDPKTFKVVGTWLKGEEKPAFGYDFWYQPYHDVMVSTEWGAPKVFKPGYNPADAYDSTKYGRWLNFYSWSERKFLKRFDLGTEGITPLEVRFMHNPKSDIGYVGCALKSNVFRFFKSPKTKEWDVQKVIEIKPIPVNGWSTDTLQGMITDILISLDDRFLYLSNWLQGDVRQYDLSDPANPKLVGQVYLGGKLVKDSGITYSDGTSPHEPVCIRGRRLEGAPQMLQLSLDGKRLYVSSSLYGAWDRLIYPEQVKAGSFIVKLLVDTEKGGLKIDPDFLVDYGTEPDGPVLAHEMRYPGGDCSSDIWLAE